MNAIGRFVEIHRWSLMAYTLGLMGFCYQSTDHESVLESECLLQRETTIAAPALTCINDCKPVVERVYICEIGPVTVLK